MDSPQTFPAHRPRIFVAFLLCFVWQAVWFGWVSSWLDLSTEVEFFVGFIPFLGAMAVLYPSDAFRKHRPPLRIGVLFLFSVVLMICSAALWAGMAFFLFAIGAVTPD